MPPDVFKDKANQIPPVPLVSVKAIPVAVDFCTLDVLGGAEDQSWDQSRQKDIEVLAHGL